MFKARAKQSKNLTFDMAPMCDIAFLILVFLIATSKFKPAEPLVINPPGFSNFVGDPDGEVATIFIADGKVMLNIPDTGVRVQLLTTIGKAAHLSFSDAETLKFKTINFVVTPLSNLKQFIANYHNSQSYRSQAGIPIDAKSNELANWIYWSEIAWQSKYNRQLYFNIKADEKVEYPLIKRVIAILQSENINKFALVTVNKTSKI